MTIAFFWCSLPIWMLLMVRPLLAGGEVAAMMLFVFWGERIEVALLLMESKRYYS